MIRNLRWFFFLYSVILFFRPAAAQVEFVENRGQWPSGLDFRARLSVGDLWLSRHSASFVLSDFGRAGKEDGHSHPHAPLRSPRVHEYRMVFEQASPGTSVAGMRPHGRYHNYYCGADSSRWRAGVRLFQEVVQKEMYPGIDVAWKEEKGNLKYEYHLAPGSNPAAIRVAYPGADRLEIRSGRLRIHTRLGVVEEQAPVCWQLRQGKKVPVAARFRLLGKNRAGFEFPGGHDPRFMLVIDPVLVFSGFSGSRSDNWGFTATYGENGAAYSGGIVLGPLFPVTPGAWDESYNGTVNNGSTHDIGILKFSSTGTNLLFATYLGGGEADSPVSLVVDRSDNLLVLGASGSSDFPVSNGAYDNTFNGGSNATPFSFVLTQVRYQTGSDLVVSKLSANGQQLIGSTFLGGSANDGLLPVASVGSSLLAKNYGDPFRGEIAVDSAGRIYVASHTLSSDFPQVQPLQEGYRGGTEAICARFSPDLSELQFSTFLGGSSDDAAYSLQVENSGRIFLAGGTASPGFPVSAGALNPQLQGGVDGFVCRFIPEQGQAGYRASFIGTPDYDQAFFVQRDLQGKVYLYGQTQGSYPVSDNVYANPGSSQFIHCLSPGLDSTRFSTVFGSGVPVTNIAPTAFLVDDCGRIYCSGWGGNTNNTPGFINGNTFNMPVTPGAFSPQTDGSDFYIIVLERNAQTLSFATYFGSPQVPDHVDGGTSRFDKKGVVYQAVCAGCGGNSTFPTTPGVYSPINQSSNCNNAIFKYDFSLLRARFAPSLTQGCAPLAVRFTSQSVFATGYRWDFQDGPAVQTSLDTITHVFDSAGTYQVKLVAENPEACPSRDSTLRTIVIEKAPEFEGDTLRFCTSGATLSLGPLPAGAGLSYSWSPATFLSSTTAPSVQVVGPTEPVVYTATVQTPLGCSRQRRFRVSDGRLEAFIKADTLQGCAPFTLGMTAKGFQIDSVRWVFGDGDSTVFLSPAIAASHIYTQPGDYQVILKARNDTACQTEVRDTLQIRVHALPLFADTLMRYCDDGPVVLQASRNRGKTFLWSPGAGLSDSTAAGPVAGSPVPQVYTVQITDSNSCRASARVSLRDGRLRAGLILQPESFCAPVILPVQNTSLNAQRCRYYWGGDSVLADGSGGAGLPLNQAGRYRIRIRAFSDTACAASDEAFADITVGGIAALPPVNQIFCPGDSALVTLFSGPGFSYSWPSNARPLAPPSRARVWTFDSLRFTVAMADSFQCPGSQDVQLVPRKPRASFRDTSLFEKCTDRLRYRMEAGVQPGYAWTWKIPGFPDGSGNPFAVEFPQRGTWPVTLIVTSDNCRDTLVRPVVVNDPALNLKADFTFRPVFTGCEENPSLLLENKSANADKYIWYWNGRSENSTIPDIRPAGPEEFTLRLVAYQDLCTREVEKKVSIRAISAPTLLTRDGNDVNDRLILGDIPPGTRLEIRDRWGRQVFQSDSYMNDWLPPADFSTGFYEFRLPNGQSCRSWVQVVYK